jgi:hypothetical protein
MRSSFRRRRLISTHCLRYSGRPTICPLVRTGARETALGRNHQILLVGIKSFRDDVLADLGAIGVRGVDKVDAELHRALQHFARLVAVLRFTPDAGAGDAHGAISKPVDREVSTQRERCRSFLCKVSILKIRRPAIGFSFRVCYHWCDPMPPTATIVGAGPNGLAAAIVLAKAGFTVEVREAASVAGGAARSAELTLPGFVHDLRIRGSSSCRGVALLLHLAAGRIRIALDLASGGAGPSAGRWNRSHAGT